MNDATTTPILGWAELLIPSLRATPGDDLHLVTGLATSPFRDLVVAAIDGEFFPADALPTGWSISITTPDLSVPGASGVTVDPLSGVIGVGPLARPPRLLSFVVTYQLLDASGTITGRPLHRRVHCHDALDAVWLTPSRLRVPRDGSGSRLTLLARFDDDVIGDITNWVTPLPGGRTWHVHPTTGTGPPVPAVTWDSVPLDPDEVDPSVFVDHGYLHATSRTDDSRVTATLSRPGEPDLVAEATVTPVARWPPSTTVHYVDGRGDGPDEMARCANVLFLPDGFRADQRSVFENLVDDIVRTLMRDPYLAPFHRLTDALNWFRAWIPSPEQGISLLRPVDLLGSPPTVKPASTPEPQPGPLLVEGDPANRPDGSGLILLDEHDTVLGICYGARPAAQTTKTDRAMGFHPRRRTEADLESFLATLTGVSSADHRWRSGGVDDRFVVILCATTLPQGTNLRRASGGRVVLVGTGNPPVTISPTGTGWRDDPAPLPVPNDFATTRVVAHELGHSLWLGDEYMTIPEEHPNPSAVDIWANLQARADVEGPDGWLRAGWIAWTWPRARHVAVLLASAQIAPDAVTVTLEAGQAAGFTVGDLVRMRTRPLVTSVTSPPLVVAAVTGGDPEVATVVLEPATDGDALPAGPFPTGSLLIAPLLDGDGAEVGLVARPMLDHLDRHSNPLNASSTDADNRPCVPVVMLPDVASATNPPPGLPAGVLTQHLVGLWDGGDDHTCGVYHATGACMMNGTAPDAARTAAHPRLCAVCRYILVDELAPHLHSAVDADYNGWPAGGP